MRLTCHTSSVVFSHFFVAILLQNVDCDHQVAKLKVAKYVFLVLY